jgi:hypothetical protein
MAPFAAARPRLPKVMFALNTQTLSSAPWAAVASIGISAFNRDGIIDRRHYLLNYADQQEKMSRDIDANTLQFWMKVQAADRNATLVDGDRLLADDAIIALDSFVKATLASVRENRALVWATGVAFHGAIFELLCRDYDVDSPFSHRAWQEVRTLNLLSGGNTESEEYEGKNHAQVHANHDAQLVIDGLERLLG